MPGGVVVPPPRNRSLQGTRSSWVTRGSAVIANYGLKRTCHRTPPTRGVPRRASGRGRRSPPGCSVERPRQATILGATGDAAAPG